MQAAGGGPARAIPAWKVVDGCLGSRLDIRRERSNRPKLLLAADDAADAPDLLRAGRHRLFDRVGGEDEPLPPECRDICGAFGAGGR